MDVHAWFNVFKVRNSTSAEVSTPLHVTRAHPSWTAAADGEIWLDPGIPEARRYLLAVAFDLIEHYDLDGINFDFMRYPGRSFPDDDSYRRHGNGMSRDDWRRANVNAFVADFYAGAIPRNPKLRVGSSPLGVYDADPVAGTSGSPHSVYQDSELWLRRGIQDYLSPQIYWDIGVSRADPDFAALAARWQTGSSGRHIYAGIGAYKPEVLRQLARQIDVSRQAGNQGQVFFRYENVQSFTSIDDRYRYPALLPPMPWKDSIPPLPPTHLAVSEVVTNVFQVEWSPSPQARDGERAARYAIYRGSPSAPNTNDPRNLVAVLPASATSYLDTVRVPTGLTYYYAVTALDRSANESAPSTVETGVVRELLALKGKLSNFTTLATAFRPGTLQPTLLGFRLARSGAVTLEVARVMAGGRDSVMAVLVQGKQDEGSHVVGLKSLRLPPGLYTVRLRAGNTTLEQPLAIRP
jgi:hypothetical protein